MTINRIDDRRIYARTLCPRCGCDLSEVRKTKGCRRRRLCLECLHTYYTREVVEDTIVTPIDPLLN